MPIDPRIAMGYQAPQIESPLNMFAKFQQIQGAHQQNQLAQMQMAEYQRGLQEQENVRNYLSGNPDITSADTLKGLYGLGKTGAEAARNIMSARKEERESQKSHEDLVSKIRNRYVTEIDSAQSPAELAKVHQAMFSDPTLGPVLQASGRTVDTGLKAIANAQSPDDFRSLKLQMVNGTEKFLSASKPTVIQQGDRLVSIDPISGRVTPVEGSQYTPQMTPFQKASLELQERLAGQGVTYQVDARGNIVALPTKTAGGTSPVGTVVTGEGGKPIPAKPTPFQEKAEAQRKQLSRDLDMAIVEIQNAIKPGGLLEKSTASGLGKMVDTGAAFFGKSTPGAEAAAALKPIADMALKLVPRFEGPQSDKDTASYKEAAGQLGNESLPVATRKKAAETIVRLMKERRNQFANQAMINEGISPVAEETRPSTKKPSVDYKSMSNEDLLRELGK